MQLLSLYKTILVSQLSGIASGGYCGFHQEIANRYKFMVKQ